MSTLHDMTNPFCHHRIRSPFAITLLAGLLLLAVFGPSGTRAQTANASGPIVVPERRPAVGPPPSPPELPESARHLTPLTLGVEIRREVPGRPPTTTRQVVTRTIDRVHLALDGDREWLFVRNPVDNRRVDGLLVLHARRTIISYDESAVRNQLGLRGWVDVLTLGLDRTALSRLGARAEVRERNGLHFVRYQPDPGTPSGARDGLEEVWWCEDQALPLEFRTVAGETRTAVWLDRISSALDESLLRRPTERFPDYAEVELAEWLEDL